MQTLKKNFRRKLAYRLGTQINIYEEGTQLCKYCYLGNLEKVKYLIEIEVNMSILGLRREFLQYRLPYRNALGSLKWTYQNSGILNLKRRKNVRGYLWQYTHT